MRIMQKRSLWLIGYGTGLVFSTVVCAAPPQYTLTEVGSLGGRYNVGYAINAHGDIVGQASTDLSESLTYHAFFYEHGRNLTTDLGTIGGPNSLARTINDCSKMAGNSDIDAYGVRHAAILSSRTDLGSLGGQSVMPIASMIHGTLLVRQLTTTVSGTVFYSTTMAT
jgi:probable HAF family extracellular repeat protein